MTAPDDDTQARLATSTALHEALQAEAPDDLDGQIGGAAVARYEATLRTARIDASEPIIAWWSRQPEDVVEAMLDAMRRRDEGIVEDVEHETETAGLALLAELVRDDDTSHGGKWIYNEVIRDQLNAVRAANAAEGDGDMPSVRAALTGLDDDDVSTRLGTVALTSYTERLERTAYAGAREIVTEWEHLPWGTRAIAELVAALHRTDGYEVAIATRESSGGAAADLTEILRNDTTRALYARLVTRVANDDRED